ncbi:ETEC_3214 domain-containing protein [Streptomyces chartreusis]
MARGRGPRRRSQDNEDEHSSSWYVHPLLNHPISSALIVTGILALLSYLFGLWGGGQGPSSEERVSKLATGVTVNYFRKELDGEEDIKRAIGKGWYELLWMKKEYAVQAFAKAGDYIKAYSLTSHSRKFHPTIPEFGGRLGVSTFTEVLGGSATAVNFYLPAGPDWRYSEALTGSGASHGKTYIMTDSFAGRYAGGQEGAELALAVDDSLDLGSCEKIGSWCFYANRDKSDVARLRKRAIVTTYTILGPGADLEEFPATVNFGPTFADEGLLIN